MNYIYIEQKPAKPKYFDFNSLRYDTNKFKATLTKRDPTPFKPRWVSGYGINTHFKPTKKKTKKPIIIEKEYKPGKKQLPSLLLKPSINIQHSVHIPSLKSEINKINRERIWNLKKNSPFRSQKKLFKRSESSKNIHQIRRKFGKKMFPQKYIKSLQNNKNKKRGLKFFPNKQRQTFDLPHPYKSGKKQFQRSQSVNNLRRNKSNLIDVTNLWRAHTPLNPESNYNKNFKVNTLMFHVLS